MSLDLSEYMGAYIDGSRENLDTMDKMLLNLEQNPANLDAVEEIFRAAHTLKGMSATMGFEKIAHLTHEMENILDKLRNQEIPVTTEVVDIIFETFDVLRTLVNDSIEATDSNIDLSEISAKLTRIGFGEVAQASSQPDQPQAATPQANSAQSLSSAGGEVINDLLQLDINDFEVAGLADAIDTGMHLFLVKVSLVSDCLLKGPRIFMILRTLDDKQCDIVKSLPEVKDLENEKFDNSFMMLVTSPKDAAEIHEGIECISEIDTVEVLPVNIAQFSGGGDLAETPSEPQTQQPQPQQQQARESAPPAQRPSQPIQKAPSAPAAPQSSVQAPIGQPAKGTNEIDVESAEDDEPTKEVVGQTQLLTFNMAGEIYGLEIRQVEAIINLVPITRVPKAPEHIDGVINLRGEIVPVINTRRKLKLPLVERKSSDQIIILSFDEEKIKAGFLVDSVNEVIGIPDTSIEPPTRVSESVEIEHLKGVGKVEGKIIILLNAQRIVFGVKKGEE